MPFFVGASCIHPSMVDITDAEKAGAPILNIPTKDEPDMVNANFFKKYREINYFLLDWVCSCLGQETIWW